MTDEKSKEKTFVDTFKEGFRTIKKELVQEDNPNSPHLVISRMNAGILGDSETETPPQKTKDKPKRKEPEKHPFGEEQFKRVVWGDDE